MEICFSTLLKQLEINLKNNRPGEWAQKLMMPQGRLMYSNHKIPPCPSAVLILLFEQNNQIYFPIIRRHKYNGSHSGQMAFPGGKFENADKNLIATALREAEEEVGIKPNKVSVIGTLSELYIPVTNMQVLPVVGYTKFKPEFLLNTREVNALFTVNINDILTDKYKGIESRVLKGVDAKIPFYNLKNQKVWGATAMIISEFEQIILKIREEYMKPRNKASRNSFD